VDEGHHRHEAQRPQQGQLHAGNAAIKENKFTDVLFRKNLTQNILYPPI
jgi:hypothetical protein